MAGGQEEKRPHILLGGNGESEPFTSPRGGGGHGSYPKLDRHVHADDLLAQLGAVEARMGAVVAERVEKELEPQEGMLIELEAVVGFDLALDSLDARQQGVELLAVKDGDPMRATAFVPHGKLGWLEKRILQYRDENTKKGSPRNQSLVGTLAAIRRAALETLWTDEEEALPEQNTPFWWEVWLRVGRDRKRLLDEFGVNAVRLGLRLHPNQRVEFLDRTVVLAWGTRGQVSESVALLDCIAELRRAKELAGEYFDLPPAFVRDLSADLVERVQLTSDNPSAVCLLDSGVNPHPLLESVLVQRDTVLDPELGVHDCSRSAQLMA